MQFSIIMRNTISERMKLLIPAGMGWSGGAIVLGKLPVPGHPTDSDSSRARTYYACSKCGWGLFGHFYLICPFSFSPSLWETARYRLKYSLKGPLGWLGGAMVLGKLPV